MICVSIAGKTYPEIVDILSDESVEMAEIRLDLCPLEDGEIEELFSNADKPLVATARGEGRKLEKAILSGAQFADLELEAPPAVSREIQKLCRQEGVELIRSFHDFDGTPSGDYLVQVLERCYRYGADIAKIVVSCRNGDDAAVIGGLYDAVLSDGKLPRKGRLIAFGMGEDGRQTRLECLSKGAPFTYAALSDEEAVAPGQWTFSDMREAAFGKFPHRSWRGLRMPASKSFSQRAILAAALSEGVSTLRGYTPCSDSEAALSVAVRLGAKLTRRGDCLELTGIGALSGRPPLKSVNVGESGLLTRLLIPLLSVLDEEDVVIEGERTLLRRPLAGAANIMASFGVVLANASENAGTEIKVPLKVKGRIVPGRAEVSGNGGSQLISGLLMALPLCGAPSTLSVTEPKSIPYLYVTQDVLRHFGIRITTEMEGDAEALRANDWSLCTGMTFNIPAPQRYRAADIELERDWSAAANFLVAGAIFGVAELPGMDTSSVQADISIMDVLLEAGALVSQTEDGVLCVRKAPLEAFEFDLDNSPDLFPIVAVLCAFCAGESRISGVGRLGSKESDRAGAILGMLEGLGVEARREDDVMVIAGEQLSSRIAGGHLLKGGRFTSSHDHRMVMALSVAALGADSPVEIDDTECVAKSFPDFPEMFK